MKTKFFKNRLKSIEIHPKAISVSFTKMAKTISQERKLGKKIDTYENKLKEQKLTIIQSFTGSINTTENWKITNWLIISIHIFASTETNTPEHILKTIVETYWHDSLYDRQY